MHRISIIAALLVIVTGCSTGFRNPRGSITISVETPPPEKAVFVIRRSDGRSWRVPAAFYAPERIATDGLAMNDYVELRHNVSRSNDVAALQEAGAGEEHSTRVLFIRGDSARLYSLYGVTRPLRPGEPLPGLTDVLQSVSSTGITLSGSYFPWKDLRLDFVGELTAVRTR